MLTQKQDETKVKRMYIATETALIWQISKDKHCWFNVERPITITVAISGNKVIYEYLKASIKQPPRFSALPLNMPSLFRVNYFCKWFIHRGE